MADQFTGVDLLTPGFPALWFATPLLRLIVTAVIDILLVAFLVYQLLVMVRGTRAARILVGILILVALYNIAVWAELDMLRTLLASVVPYTGLAIIVLFQSEIRRTLARIGRRRLFGRGSGRPEVTDEILLAVNRLTGDQIGALIVMEKDVGLRTFIESGVPLDAKLSRDLLLSIFLPGSAMHDGAVIVQKDRVAAAACFLPLSLNPALAARLGTRHRAGIGITEETDCLSIIVSEETGKVSVARGGEIIEGLSEEDLDGWITRHFSDGGGSSKAPAEGGNPP